MKLNYLTEEQAIFTHQKIIEISGGRKGIKNIDYIISPIFHIQNDDYYPTLEEKLTHLVFSINKFHGFNDGNKRSSIALGLYLLLLNGLDVFADKFVIEMENIAVAVADNLIDKNTLEEIIFSLINEEDYPENLKLKIIDALSKVVVKPNEPELDNGLDFYINLF
jgi:death-on-curing protein